MNNSTVLENKPKYYCELCNYGCNHNSVFKKHQKSDKHNRHGEKKYLNVINVIIKQIQVIGI